MARLLDGAPASPLPTDHADAVAALIGSTDQLATLGADLNAFMRLLGRCYRARSSDTERGIVSLAEDVQRHVAIAAPLVAKLEPDVTVAFRGVQHQGLAALEDAGAPRLPDVGALRPTEVGEVAALV